MSTKVLKNLFNPDDLNRYFSRISLHIMFFWEGGGWFESLHFLKGESKFWLPPPKGGESEKLKKGWKYGGGAGLLKRERLALFLFKFFKVYHFHI